MLLWDARVADEAAYEARIEAAFDRADAQASVGNLERALESLAIAEDLCGGLPDAYIPLREHWISLLSPHAVAVRR